MIADKEVDKLFSPTFGAMAKKLGLLPRPEEKTVGGTPEQTEKKKS